MTLLHRRLGHSGQPAIQRLLNENMATRVKLISSSSSILPCDDCQLGKLTRPSHPSVPFRHNTIVPLQVVVMDLAGPIDKSQRGCKFEPVAYQGVLVNYQSVESNKSQGLQRGRTSIR